MKNIIPLIVAVLVLAACTPAMVTETPVVTEPALTEPAATDLPAPTPTYETVKVKIASFPYITEAPFFFAQEEGYFAEQGLEVEFVRFERATDAMPALIAGEIVASTILPAPALLNAIAGGGTIKIVVGKGYFDPTACVYSGLMVSPETMESGRLDDPANWVGLKVSTERGAATEYGIDLFLQKNGLSLDDIEIVDLPIFNRQEALTNGAIDIAAAGEPFITRFTNAGAAVMWQGFNILLPDFAFGTVAFGPTFLEEHPDVGQRFMIALLKGIAQYNQGKTARNLEIIAQYTQLDPAEIEQTCWQVMRADGEVNVQSILDFQTWAVAKGLVDVPVTAEQIYDPSFLEYAREFLP